MASKKLRAVKPGEKASGPLSVTAAAASGDHLALLRSLRDRVARAVEDPETPARDLAALARRLQDLSREAEERELAEAPDGGLGELPPDEEFRVV